MKIRHIAKPKNVRGKPIIDMLTDKQKKISEDFISFHKKHGGTLTPDKPYEFKESIGATHLDLKEILNKLIALDLIKYKFPDRTGWTDLTKKGWDFTNFADHDNQLMSQSEIDHLTIEKLRIDLKTAKRNARMYWILTPLTIVAGLSGIIRTEQNKDLTKRTESRVNTIDSAVHSLSDKLEQVLSDTSRHASKSKSLH